jgi:hypothetical protein
MCANFPVFFFFGGGGVNFHYFVHIFSALVRFGHTKHSTSLVEGTGLEKTFKMNWKNLAKCCMLAIFCSAKVTSTF